MINSIGRYISMLHRQSQIYINESLKEFNITSSEYAFLLCLYRGEGKTQDQLSCYLYIDKAATARAIKSLEQKGYVTKDRDKRDRRCNRIYLTDKARACRDEVRRRVWQWSELLTEDVDPLMIDSMVSILQKMADKGGHNRCKKSMEEI